LPMIPAGASLVCRGDCYAAPSEALWLKIGIVAENEGAYLGLIDAIIVRISRQHPIITVVIPKMWCGEVTPQRCNHRYEACAVLDLPNTIGHSWTDCHFAASSSACFIFPSKPPLVLIFVLQHLSTTAKWASQAAATSLQNLFQQQRITMSGEFEMFFKSGSVWELRPQGSNTAIPSSTSLQRLRQRSKSEVLRPLKNFSSEGCLPQWTNSGQVCLLLRSS
jgi:hypothetical protein